MTRFVDVNQSQNAVELSVSILQQGGVVALPTETVYGFAADATDDRAVEQIYKLKGRPAFNPLICHFASVDGILQHCEPHPRLEDLSQAFWPGPLTVILKRKLTSTISPLVTAGLPTVAVRVPKHPLIQSVLQGLTIPLAAPSANISESVSPTTAQHIQAAFPNHPLLSAIVDGGPCHVGVESTIVDLSAQVPILLRPGQICVSDLRAILPNIIVPQANAEAPVRAPGMLKRHYAPRHRLRMNATFVRGGEALLAFGPNVLQGAQTTLNLSASGNLDEAARNLFDMIQRLDQQNVQGIAVMAIPEHGIGIAINDRLNRACAR